MRVGRRPPPSPRLPWVAVAVGAALTALLAVPAADLRWLAALGGEVARLGRIPAGVPFATAPTDGWPNVPVLGELVLHALAAVPGDRGFLLAQTLAVSAALVVTLVDARRLGAGDRATTLVLVLLLPACLSALLTVRSQLFSLALFPLLLLLLRAEA